MPTGPWGCHSSSAKAAGSCAVGSGGGRECWEREPAQCDLAGVRVVRGGKAGLREGPSCLTPEETLHHMALWLYRVRCVRYRKNNKNDRHCSTQQYTSLQCPLPAPRYYAHFTGEETEAHRGPGHAKQSPCVVSPGRLPNLGSRVREPVWASAAPVFSSTAPVSLLLRTSLPERFVGTTWGQRDAQGKASNPRPG